MEEERKIVLIKCTSCNSSFKMYMPKTGGLRKVTCPGCKNEMTINFGPKKEEEPQQTPGNKEPKEQSKKETKDISNVGGTGMQRGKLVQVRGFMQKNISHPLQIGDNIVGQYDLAMPSTIMIKDNTISRQSVNIKVDYKESQIDYRLCLLRSKNPVLLNGTPIQVGEERYLNFGDSIVLGQTKFRFEKA